MHSAAALRGLDRAPGARRTRARAASPPQLMQTPPWIETVTDPRRAASRTRRAGSRRCTELKSAPAPGGRRRGHRRAGDGVAGARRARPRPDAARADRRTGCGGWPNGPYWRYPTLRLNQINWYAEVYSAAAEATGDPSYLQRDLRGQLAAFIRSIRSPAPDTAGSLGPGMQFHYIPDGAAAVEAQHRLGRVREHRRVGRRASTTARVARGMRPLPPEDEALLRRWMTRVLAGYWTHARLPELGHRLQLRPLAPDEEVRARPAGADRDRRRRAAVAVAAARRRGPSTSSSAASSSTSASCREGEGVAPGPVLSAARRTRSPTSRRCSAPRGWPPTRPARWPPGSAPRPAPSRRRCTRSTPRPAAWRSRRPATTPRSPPSRTARTRTAGSTSRGSTTTARRSPPRSAPRQPSSFGIVVRNRRGRARLVTARPASDLYGRRRPLRLLRAPRRRRQRGLAAAPVRGAVQDAAGDAGCARRRGVEARSTYTFRPHARSSANGRVRTTTSRRRSAEVLFPSTGGDAGGGVGDPARRDSRQVDAPRDR